MSDIDEIQDKLDKLTRWKEIISHDQAALKQKKDAMDGLREELLFDLQANRLESLKNDKLTVTIAQKPSVTITDPVKVEAWLEANEFNIDEYKKLDPIMVKTLAEGRYKDPDYGEVMDGVEIGTTEYLTIRSRDNG